MSRKINTFVILQIKAWNEYVQKKCYGYNFAFQASILNQRIKNRYVLRLIQWQNLKRKIVAVAFFLKTFIFANIAKIPVSVDFDSD